ncbi:MAG: hypothetical protein SVR04_14670 [Spirochaetota bacterium]|nr:hypothetical protein [Spirochaetota bacterium]
MIFLRGKKAAVLNAAAAKKTEAAMEIKSGAWATIAAAVLLLIFTGCSSLPVSQRPSSVESLVYKLHTGDAETAADLTDVPFLLDGEILVTERDAGLMWENLKKVPDLLADAEVLSITPAVPADYTKFADSSDMRVFFERALPENPTLVEIETSFGRFLLLVSGKKLGIPVLAGMKGPIR